jgi:CO/xanthine dehydrogenase Mo-binding subunit
MSQREQIKDLLQARQDIRKAKKTVNETRAAYSLAQAELREANARAEKVLVQIEHKQGVLPLDDGDQQSAAEA